MEVLIRDLYCYECSLQFDTKYVLDVHLSVAHGEKLEINQEPDSQHSVIPEAKGLEIKLQDEEINWKKQSKRRKGSMKMVSGHKGKEKFKCEICDASFRVKGSLNKHVSIVHEGKKQFLYDICNANFGQKSDLNKHVATVHDGKKQFKCGICEATRVIRINMSEQFMKEINHLNVTFVMLNLDINTV